MNRIFRNILAPFLVGFLLIITYTPADAARTSKDTIKHMVAREARDLGIPVSLALAIAHAESSFNPSAVSHKGARGVMQIMPATALGEYGIHPRLLWNPRVNIRLGLHYLGRLIRKYRGRTDLALSFYNGGSAVGPPHKARIIPATYPYVRKVLRLQEMYRDRIYRDR
jgi:soluble lytic murein transglycosylase-like protein